MHFGENMVFANNMALGQNMVFSKNMILGKNTAFCETIRHLIEKNSNLLTLG